MVFIVAWASLAAPVASAQDSDGDGWVDVVDNCIEVANVDQADPDHDGFGVACDPDFNENGAVDVNDLSILLQRFGARDGEPEYESSVDLTRNGVIDINDATRVAAAFGKAPGPSGLPCAGQVPCLSIVDDSDLDGVHNDADVCRLVADPDQLDVDGDGYGNRCDGDLDGDGDTDEADRAAFDCGYAIPLPPGVQSARDFDGDGDVDFGDKYRFLYTLQGYPPGPGRADAPAFVPNANTEDEDGDGVENYRDNCLGVPNPDLRNGDYDLYGDACDGDLDNDGDVDADDRSQVESALGAVSPGPGYRSEIDWVYDLQIDAADLAYFDTLAGQPWPSSGLFCPAAGGTGTPPAGANLALRMAPNASLETLLPLVHPGISSSGSLVPVFSIPYAPDPTQGSAVVVDSSTGLFDYTTTDTFTGVEFEYRVANDSGYDQAKVKIEAWTPADDVFVRDALGAHAIVVYNENDPDAQGIAEYYRTIRHLDMQPGRLCPVRMPVGLYATKAQMLAARATIVQDCICPLIDPGVRPAGCGVAAIDAVAAVSPISHMVLIRGLPSRLHQTGLPLDSIEPGLDAFLAAQLYRSEDLFACGSAAACDDALDDLAWSSPRTAGVDDGRPPRAYTPALDVARHRWIAHGRVEAMTPDRTRRLIVRTYLAEMLGFAGNVTSSHLREHVPLQELVSSFGPSCDEQVDLGSDWDPAVCRAGTTFSNASTGLDWDVPGEPGSSIPLAENVGLMLSSTATWLGTGVNGQTGFDGFPTLRSWRKANAPAHCAQSVLCEDAPDPSVCQLDPDDPLDFVDYFGELDPDCVGGSRSLMGTQYRSFPVAYYGFFPKGWNNGGSGHTGKTPPQVRKGGAYQSAAFSDDVYLHFGRFALGDPIAAVEPTCPSPAGGMQVCPEGLGIDLGLRQVLPAPVDPAQPHAFDLRFRLRNHPSPGGRLSTRITFVASDGTRWVAPVQDVALDVGHATWVEAGLQPVAPPTSLVDVATIELRVFAEVGAGLVGWLDLDGFELVDEAQGASSLLPADVASFVASDHHVTHLGDYASTAIDRLGALAWWGSSGHGYGGELSNQLEVARAFFSGRSLGEAFSAHEFAGSGALYGDPLYRASAAALFFPMEDRIYATALAQVGGGWARAAPGLVIDPSNLARYRTIYVNAMHGLGFLDAVHWELATCPMLDARICEATPGAWTVRRTETGSAYERPIDWTQGIVDVGQDQDVTLRLRVWIPGEEANALTDYAYLQIRMQ